eukprot:770_1
MNDDLKEYAYVHRVKHQIPPTHLINGIERCAQQAVHGALTTPIVGVVNGLKKIGKGNPISGIKHITIQALTGAEKIVTAPALMTNGLFNTFLSNNNQDNDEKMETIAVRYLLRKETDFIDNKVLGIKSGNGWSQDERNSYVLLRHGEKARSIAVELRNEIEPTHIISGLTGGIKEITFSVGRPLKGLFDIVYKPYELYKKDKDKSFSNVPKGVWIGLRNTVASPCMVAKDAICGTKKIVSGILNTPGAGWMYHQGYRFNSWIGWTTGYKIKTLNRFPGKVGDMLCVQQTIYSHTMIKLGKNRVIHRTGEANSGKRGFSKMEIRNVHAGIAISSLDQIQKCYKGQCITVVDADYCVVKKDEKHLVYKKRSTKDIIKMANDCYSINANSSGWELFRKNCEHLCFWILYGVDISIQIQQLISLNQ